jgi:GTPase SAR1 family protein
MFNLNLDFNKKTEVGSNVRLIGDRKSGKSTFMAALARWPNANANSPVKSISAFTESGEKIIEQAQNILEQGLELSPTDVSQDISQECGIRVTLKDKFSLFSSQSEGDREIKLDISSKDYAGEFFSDLIHTNSDSRLDSYLQDCIMADGLMLMVDGTARKDSEYAMGIEKLFSLLDKSEIDSRSRRIAMVLTKGEQAELLVNRNQKPQLIVERRFPQLYRKLQNYNGKGAFKIEYFLSSAFGTLGNKTLEPNSKIINRDKGGTSAVIKTPRLWRPFGLVSPLYWLCTGSKHRDLEQE